MVKNSSVLAEQNTEYNRSTHFSIVSEKIKIDAFPLIKELVSEQNFLTAFGPTTNTS